MANIFLDTNKVIDIAIRKPKISREISGHQVYISPLSIHVLCYSQHIKIPNNQLTHFKNQYEIINLSDEILNKSLTGPTPDLEDNIQLHCAAEAECDYFLTSDEKLLKMKFFGKTQITITIKPNLWNSKSNSYIKILLKKSLF